MNDPLEPTSYRTSQQAEAAMPSSALWPSLTEKFAKHKLVHGELRLRKDVPFFCNPVVIFLANWAFMLVSLSFQITYVTYPSMGMPLLLLGLSVGSFLFGYIVSRMLLHRWPAQPDAP